MTLRHLEIFEAVAQCGNMTRAAQQLYISQPAVSQAVRELEREYEVRLFERLSGRLLLTEEGKLLQARARHVLEVLAATREELSARAAAPVLRIGASVTVGACMMLPLTEAMEHACPGADLRVQVCSTGELQAALLAGELDCAVIEGEIGEGPEITQEPLWRDEMVLVAGRTHPLYAAPAVPLARLQGIALIAREQGSADHNQLEQFLLGRGIRMVKKWSSTNVAAIKQVTEAGRGVAMLSRRLVQQELRTGTLRVLPLVEENGDPLRFFRDIKLCWHTDKYLAPALLQFFTLCRTAEQNGILAAEE